MDYTISYDMASDLIRVYLERIYVINKHKGISRTTVEEFFNRNLSLVALVDQMRSSGVDVDSLISSIENELKIKYTYDYLEVRVDAATRRNQSPNPLDRLSGYAFQIIGDGETIYKHRECVGSHLRLPRLRNEPFGVDAQYCEATNNVTEYHAVLQTVNHLLTQGITAGHIEVISDNKDVVFQINNRHCAKSPHTIRYRDAVWQMIPEFENITFTHVDRSENHEVDTYLRTYLDDIEEMIKEYENS
jgi:ribonuclease HI